MSRSVQGENSVAFLLGSIEDEQILKLGSENSKCRKSKTLLIISKEEEIWGYFYFPPKGGNKKRGKKKGGSASYLINRRYFSQFWDSYLIKINP